MNFIFVIYWKKSTAFLLVKLKSEFFVALWFALKDNLF